MGGTVAGEIPIPRLLTGWPGAEPERSPKRSHKGLYLPGGIPIGKMFTRDEG